MEDAIIDTSIVIDILRGKGKNYKKVLESYVIHISSITGFEIYYGIFKKGSKKEKIIFERFLEGVIVESLDIKVMEMAAFIARFFEKNGIKISNEDAIIIATGITRNLKIITRDKKWEVIKEIYPDILIME